MEKRGEKVGRAENEDTEEADKLDGGGRSDLDFESTLLAH